MEEVHVVRHKVLVEGKSRRAVAKELGRSINTIRRYLDDEIEPGKRRATRKRKPEHDAIEARIIAILDESPKWTRGKQRLTAKRLTQLVAEEGHVIGYTFVKDVVREYRRRRREVFVPLVYRPGELAEVDFFEVFVDVAGQRVKAFLFVIRLMFSGRDFCALYPRQDATCFLDGHVRAFAHFGGVPWRIIYDNLKPAVSKILVGSERELTKRFIALSSHYLFEPCFARPATGHDKGGVEARGKGIRWQHLVPIPQGQSLDELSVQLQQRVDAQPHDQRFDEEKPRLLPLPPASFAPAKVVTHEISPRSLVKIDGAVYSVPSSYARLDAMVHVGAFDVVIVCPGGERVHHEKQPFGGRSVRYVHYVRELRTKPQAVRQVADVFVAELGAPFVEKWRDLVDEYGEKEASRHLAKIVGAIDDFGLNDVRQALLDGKLRFLSKPVPQASVAVPEVLRVDVQGPDFAAYDELLQRGAA